MPETTKVYQFSRVPATSIIEHGFGRVDYCDTYRIAITPGRPVDAVHNQLFVIPSWVVRLLRLRNAAVSVFGLRTGGAGGTEKKDFYPVGSRAVYFTVLARADNEIVSGECDTHLDFRTSTLVERAGDLTWLWLTTVVQYNNLFGRLYFLPVKPFHRLIMKTLMKKFAAGEPGAAQG